MTFTDYIHLWWLFPLLVTLPVLGIYIHDVLLWKRMPPGPPPTFLIGNKREIPDKYPWIKFQEWSKQYGDIYTVWLGRRPTIIISDPQVAVELMEKRSQKYSSRPRFVVMGEIYWEQASILVQPYGKEWSIRRKLLHTALTPRALQNYIPVQQAEACRLCYQLLARPQEWEQLLDWMTASIVFSISYGHRIDSITSPVIRERLSFMHYSASLNVPGRYLAESFPLLAKLPPILAPWKRTIQSHGALEAAANMRLVNHVKTQIARSEETNTPIPNSLCKQLLARRAADPQQFALLSDRDFSFIPASLFGAGADTTASSLCSAFLALITHPHTQAAAHAELDAVVGRERLPGFADEGNLPYMRALCKEVLRWRPVAVLGGTPHATSERDEYCGWEVPKGTNVLGNTWAINHNEAYYPESQRFEPLRFLDREVGGLGYLERGYVEGWNKKGEKSHPSKLGHSSFGWGRRICPGADLASGNLFVALARVLWCFEIRGREGVVYDTWDYVGGFNVRPRSFECDVKIRSPQHEKVLREEYEEARAVMDQFPLFKEETAV